jgi:inner membrane protein
MNNSKQLLKAAIITVLIALLLIPTWFIGNLVTERKQRKQEITKEVSANWATAQTISSPYLQVFYNKNSSSGAPSAITAKGYVYPKVNNSIATAQTNSLKRSIFKIPVYTSNITSEGIFSKEDLEQFKNTYGAITYANSYLAINITDAKGIMDSATITINGKSYALNIMPINGITNVKTLAVPLSLLTETTTADIAYKINFGIRGTEKINFLPLAANNSLTLNSNWKSPSFEGLAANDKPAVANGFKATWKINGNSLSIPKISDTWVDASMHIFGVNFINVVDSYTQTQRCIKYALLFIGLTFSLFFFIELLKHTQIHPIQYALVGLALVIFYTLLLSISEYIDFGWAYAIAATATILLVGYYATNVMHSAKNGLLITIVLTLLYAFMYAIIQLEENSLLVGSIGLFATLATIMHLSKKIKWDALPNLIPNTKN